MCSTQSFLSTDRSIVFFKSIRLLMLLHAAPPHHGCWILCNDEMKEILSFCEACRCGAVWDSLVTPRMSFHGDAWWQVSSTQCCDDQLQKSMWLFTMAVSIVTIDASKPPKRLFPAQENLYSALPQTGISLVGLAGPKLNQAPLFRSNFWLPYPNILSWYSSSLSPSSCL